MNNLNESQQKLLAGYNSSFKMWMFLFWKLPSAWFMGVRVREVTPETGKISLPFGWRSQNPFRSIYFAAQCSAAEMSTGLLGLLAIEGKGAISMLVSHLEADFIKKAVSTTVFTCNDGGQVFAAVDRAIETNQPQTLVMTSTGVQATGETVAVVKVTWSFKVKSGV